MWLLVRTEVGLVAAFLAGMLVTYVGLALSVSGQDRLVGVAVLLFGVWVMVSAPVEHDRMHRGRGEAPHAVWGRDDRRKPGWWRYR